MKLQRLKELVEEHKEEHKKNWAVAVFGEYEEVKKIEKFILGIEIELKDKTLSEYYRLKNSDVFYLIKILPVISNLTIVINIKNELGMLSCYGNLLYSYRQDVLTDHNYQFFCELSDENLSMIADKIKLSLDFGILLRTVIDKKVIENEQLVSLCKFDNSENILSALVNLPEIYKSNSHLMTQKLRSEINNLIILSAEKKLLDEKMLVKKIIALPKLKLTISSSVFIKQEHHIALNKIKSLSNINKIDALTSAYKKHGLLHPKNNVQDVSMPSMNEENLKSYKSSN